MRCRHLHVRVSSLCLRFPSSVQTVLAQFDTQVPPYECCNRSRVPAAIDNFVHFAHCRVCSANSPRTAAIDCRSGVIDGRFARSSLLQRLAASAGKTKSPSRFVATAVSRGFSVGGRFVSDEARTRVLPVPAVIPVRFRFPLRIVIVERILSFILIRSRRERSYQ